VFKTLYLLWGILWEILNEGSKQNRLLICCQMHHETNHNLRVDIAKYNAQKKKNKSTTQKTRVHSITGEVKLAASLPCKLRLSRAVTWPSPTDVGDARYWQFSFCLIREALWRYLANPEDAISGFASTDQTICCNIHTTCTWLAVRVPISGYTHGR